MNKSDNENIQLHRSAAAGDTDAMFNVGVLAEGEGDVAGARDWYEQAAAGGHTDAMYNLGVLADGEGDVAGARTWWEQAAAGGHTSAMNNLGVLVAGEGDVAGARTWWEQAAAAGNLNAMMNLGGRAWDEGDVSAARDWYERAAAAGHPDAPESLGELAWDEDDDVSAARYWYERAAAEGRPDALRCLGHLAEDEGDVAGARIWWERAAAGGDSSSMKNLGNLAEGEGDVAGARTWWEQAADGGEKDAMLSLGHLAEGEGDVAGARDWFEQAVAAGASSAMTQLEHLARSIPLELPDQLYPGGEANGSGGTPEPLRSFSVEDRGPDDGVVSYDAGSEQSWGRLQSSWWISGCFNVESGNAAVSTRYFESCECHSAPPAETPCECGRNAHNTEVCTSGHGDGVYPAFVLEDPAGRATGAIAFFVGDWALGVEEKSMAPKGIARIAVPVRVGVIDTPGTLLFNDPWTGFNDSNISVDLAVPPGRYEVISWLAVVPSLREHEMEPFIRPIAMGVYGSELVAALDAVMLVDRDPAAFESYRAWNTMLWGVMAHQFPEWRKAVQYNYKDDDSRGAHDRATSWLLQAALHGDEDSAEAVAGLLQSNEPSDIARRNELLSMRGQTSP